MLGAKKKIIYQSVDQWVVAQRGAEKQKKKKERRRRKRESALGLTFMEAKPFRATHPAEEAEEGKGGGGGRGKGKKR